MCADCPLTCHPMLKNPAVPHWITEGQKKADALASRWMCALALLGVWKWKGRNEFGASTILLGLFFCRSPRTWANSLMEIERVSLDQ